MVAWQNRLLGREGGGRWIQLGVSRQRMPVGPAVNTLLRRDDLTRLAVWHWYWTNHRIIASDVVAKMILALDHLTGQPDDAAFVAVFAPYSDSPAEARPLVEAFLERHAAAIETVLRDVAVDP